jgi:beta-glucosidase
MKRLLTIVLLMLCLQLVATPTVEAQDSVVPTPRTNQVFRTETWMGRFYDNVRAVQSGDVDLLMVGDSITHAWDGPGKPTWDRYYGHRKAVNLGFGGDRTQHVLWRLIHGELGDIAPKVAVVMIGTNNANMDNPNEIFGGVRAVTNTLRGILPQTKVLILAVFPRGATANDWRRKNNEAANALIAELDDGEWVHYLDIGDSFLQSGGVLPESIMPDGLHPNAEGYEIWAAAMEPTLARLMGDTPVR